MKPASESPPENKENPFRAGYLILAGVSASVLLLAFVVSALELSFAVKTPIFLAVSAGYLFFCFLFYFRQSRSEREILPETTQNKIPATQTDEDFSEEATEKLRALEEASAIFGSALKPADMFRLVANRAAEIVSFKTIALYLPDDDRKSLELTQIFGGSTAELTENQAESAQVLARRAFEKRETTLDEKLRFDAEGVSTETPPALKSAVALPLARGAEIYGVLVLYGEAENSFDRQSIRLLEAVAERVAPLFLSSLAFEANLNNALTDALTKLPNERALFLVLENQIAESQRRREERPLTVLSVDIKDFDELNRAYGHATGDHILGFVAEKIKAQLRQMDFLSRAAGDEFLAVLPTASGEIAEAIVGRIEKTFAANSFRMGETAVTVRLNFGAASFSKDGETAADLLKTAKLKKHEAKSTLKGSLLRFPEKSN